MLLWFYLITVYQTMPNSPNYRRRAEETDSLDLIKRINVTPNVNKTKSSKTNKRAKVITNIRYRSQAQIHATGRDYTLVYLRIH